MMNHCFYSNETQAVCVTSPLMDVSLLNVYQEVKIGWLNVDRKSIVPEDTFMYKPDPFINKIQPKDTIVR